MRKMGLGPLLILLLAPAASAVQFGQTDDFEEGLEGWTSGMSNPNGPEVESDAGPGGAGDDAMLATATGGGGAGGKLVIFNQDQWSGNYLAAGVNQIEMDLENRGGAAVMIRLALGASGARWVATDAVALPAASGFVHATFSLRPEDLTMVSGVGSIEDVLADVAELRILNSAAPDFRGDIAAAELTVDNILGTQPLDCVPGPLDAKATEPSDLLILPGFEVDRGDPLGLNTLISVTNQLDTPVIALVQYYDLASEEPLVEQPIALAPRASRPQNVRDVLTEDFADDGGIVRGWLAIRACIEGGMAVRDGETDDKGIVMSPLARSLTGEYYFTNAASSLATGDALLRPDELCQRLQVRILDFPTGPGVKLRIFATDPRGTSPVSPATATVRVFNELGVEQEVDDLFLDTSVAVIQTTDLTPTAFGVLELDFGAGAAGALTVEYQLGDTFSISLNANCLDTGGLL